MIIIEASVTVLGALQLQEYQAKDGATKQSLAITANKLISL